jgi:hypothetical protein
MSCTARAKLAPGDGAEPVTGGPLHRTVTPVTTRSGAHSPLREEAATRPIAHSAANLSARSCDVRNRGAMRSVGESAASATGRWAAKNRKPVGRHAGPASRGRAACASARPGMGRMFAPGLRLVQRSAVICDPLATRPPSSSRLLGSLVLRVRRRPPRSRAFRRRAPSSRCGRRARPSPSPWWPSGTRPPPIRSTSPVPCRARAAGWTRASGSMTSSAICPRGSAARSGCARAWPRSAVRR